MIMVTGGAGYIGSHVALELLRKGHHVLVLDDLSTGHLETVERLKALTEAKEMQAHLQSIMGDIGDRELLLRVFSRNDIEAVVHLAAFSQVNESMLKPGLYLNNNVSKTLVLLECMVERGVPYMVFSSSASVYGEAANSLIVENETTKPNNVYGSSKLMVEDILKWYDRIHGLKSMAFRYFNAAGADERSMIGEWHEPETHLIPLIIQTALKQRDFITVYGDDYPTSDGTCIRDYVHVTDIAAAHILGLESLFGGLDSRVYNLGNERGFSVREVIDKVEEITGLPVPVRIGERRQGDPAILVASSAAIKQDLGWKPLFPELDDIIMSAWRWHMQRGEF